MDNVDAQDITAWITQGAIADRTKENLGASDNGIALYRRVLRREIKKVEEGIDPMFTFRDPAQNVRIDLPNEGDKHHNAKACEAGSCASTPRIRRSPTTCAGCTRAHKPRARRRCGWWASLRRDE